MPNILDNLNNEEILELYLKSLSPNEMKSYLIAKNHLGSTFNIVKTISFIQWKKSVDEKENVK
jgi:hypothetical protein